MQVMDIINRAVMKSGVVSNFNPDEVPEDIQQRAADVLRNEIIEDLNCDRAGGYFRNGNYTRSKRKQD